MRTDDLSTLQPWERELLLSSGGSLPTEPDRAPEEAAAEADALLWRWNWMRDAIHSGHRSGNHTLEGRHVIPEGNIWRALHQWGLPVEMQPDDKELHWLLRSLGYWPDVANYRVPEGRRSWIREGEDRPQEGADFGPRWPGTRIPEHIIRAMRMMFPGSL